MKFDKCLIIYSLLLNNCINNGLIFGDRQIK